MNKIKLPDYTFLKLLSLMGDFSEYWWAVNIQSGPFNSLWFFESEENEKIWSDAFVEFDDIGNSSVYLLNKCVFPELAIHLIIDEFSYIAAFKAGNEQEAVKHFEKYFLNYKGDFYQGWIEGADVFMFYPDGEWIVHSKDSQLLKRLKEI